MSLDCHTDRELLARFIHHGDQDAFAQIVRRHGAMVYRICARLCGTRQDAEDAAQYVFATLARKAGTLHARTCFAGWLHRTASHTALRWRRSAATRRRHEQLAGALRLDFTQGGDGLEELDESESIDQLQRALGALPEDYRNALILHHLEGHTVEEVAQLLAAPPGTIASRLSRGRAMLRERMAILGVVLLTSDLDQLLDPAVGVDTASIEAVTALAEADYPAPAAYYFSKAPAPVAFGCSVAAPLVPTLFGMKLTFGTVLITLCWSAAASAGTYVTYSTFFKSEPPPPVAATPAAPQFNSPIGFSGSSPVPEPSGVCLLATAAGLMLRRRRRRR